MSESEAELEAIVDELPRKKLSGKKLVILGVAFLALAGGGVAAMQVMGGGKETKAETEVEEEPAAEGEEAATSTYVEVPDMMVNLRTADGRSRFLKVRVMLEAPSAADAAAIKEKLPAVIDGFQVFLRELRPEDLAGASGSYRVKEEMLVRVNRAVAPKRIDDVLIQELIQQ